MTFFRVSVWLQTDAKDGLLGVGGLRREVLAVGRGALCRRGLCSVDSEVTRSKW